ncbi:glycosyl hydrolase [Marivirga tractuosa]|uniref:Glycosyl transferase family 2 n=1 Tax=Marivirga tractuosa (strain ATCC 23168 / DSM 4126 / NBRC 15989 / NCIMB 1408 / VKM B-1430 / H-43) TaxID=643867 RepID=E4TLQ5_MARTH|nr:glycosyltransferase family 2 protein [Marivirga tractuosa]ADR23334.1 glycosyl transferase family 2 [Marivirga tractuosa DSM 4126]BDD15992.1 glycosyl hydrolase [Marivirga tractuosa]
MDSKIIVIIPAFNEENAVGKVVKAIPKEWVEEIVVVNNNSTDKTREAAEQEGALVLDQPSKGYGNACLKGIEYVKSKDEKPDVIVFLDADYSDYPEQLPELVKPILQEEMDIVIGSRALGEREGGSMTFPQVFGNWLATRLIRLFYGYRFTDLGPFRAIRWDKLMEVNMQDKTFGWTVEMQVKAAKMKMKCTEVPMAYRNRIGKSKVSGTVYGTIMAGYKILYTIFKYL